MTLKVCCFYYIWYSGWIPPVYYAWFSKIHNMQEFIERIVRWNKKRTLLTHFKQELHKHLNSNTL